MDDNDEYGSIEDYVRSTAARIIAEPAWIETIARLRCRTMDQVAKKAKVAPRILDGLRAGETTGTLRDLFAIARSYNIDPDKWDEWDDDRHFQDNSPFRGGTKKQRDRWYGIDSDAYQDHFHREIKPDLKGIDPNSIGKEDHDRWYKEWKDSGGKRPEELSRPLK